MKFLFATIVILSCFVGETQAFCFRPVIRIRNLLCSKECRHGGRVLIISDRRSTCENGHCYR